MKNIAAWKEEFLAGKKDCTLTDALSVAEANVPAQRERYAAALDAFAAKYGDGDISVYSVGGRSEISGNHTDHNHGRVIAASVNLDILAVAKATDAGVIRIQSEGFPEDVVEPAAIDAPDEAKFFTSAAIIAGMEKAFLNAGYKVGGFDAYTTSNVLKGSGISSSAAFEVMVGNILNYLYNDGRVSNVEIAKMAQFAENKYFGKPCGLMDQTACAVGGFITIDFADPTSPVIEKMDFDLGKAGYALCIVNTGGNHADLNDDYASIPAEMKKVASLFGKEVLRGISEYELIEKAPEIRKAAGDRALLRALHFANEDARVPAIAAAMKEGDVAKFLGGITASGNSSFKYLQNVFTTKNPSEQGESLAIYLSERALASFPLPGACRVHGGGFAGTMQAFVPRLYTEAFRQSIDEVMGEGSCMVMHVRPVGATRVDND